ncbi:MAG: hypothetical protein WC778_07110 [Negativicutes bacterium]
MSQKEPWSLPGLSDLVAVCICRFSCFLEAMVIVGKKPWCGYNDNCILSVGLHSDAMEADFIRLQYTSFGEVTMKKILFALLMALLVSVTVFADTASTDPVLTKAEQETAISVVRVDSDSDSVQLRPQYWAE